MVFQGLSPTFVGSLSDTIGRRPVYIFCFVTYIAANVGLALSNSFIALLLLRCLQSTGSSSTVNLAYGVTADVVTSAERGRYIGLASVGPIIGPSLGPVLGGVITQYLGWRYIFVILAAAALIFLFLLIIFFPETCRNLVGNGSIPPKSLWNRSLVSLFKKGSKLEDHASGRNLPNAGSKKSNPRNTNPLKALNVLFEYPTSPVIIFNGLSYAIYYAITSSLSYSFHDNYYFDDIHVGLSYIPIGVGTIIAALGNGFVVDWNYRRLANKAGIDIDQGRHMDYETGKRLGFSIEKARLQIAVPAVVVACISMLGYAWTMSLRLPPIIPLLCLFVFGWGGTAAYSCMNVLIVDINYSSAASATAANNLVRCLLGAGGAAVIMPLINVLGMGWTFTAIAGLWVLLSPLVLFLLFRREEVYDEISDSE
uniref:MFS-type transporter phiL n=1 Tax=Fungal sp. (strain ATCC 74256) TaxID=1729595 RepID=PHIL_FUNX7|nr:RecName: Full=MFS-type transporter phiL; AltName: Full=Phomoidride biosynthesis cluster protein L [fungal sp. ATCC 74256]BBG28509.1 putative transporter [fungal sp. ATCC 74256]